MTMKLLPLFLFALLIAPRPAVAAAIREEFDASVAELQNNPGDQALREKIIGLALKLEPKPGIPEEAERRMARGRAAVGLAADKDGYREAAKEFEKAALAAPWLAEAYFNLGVVSDKAGDYAEAIENLKLYLLAAPGANNARNVKTQMYEIEYRLDEERAGSMAVVPAGEFKMGVRRGKAKDEKPQHKVFVNEFSMDVYEATQREFYKVMGRLPSDCYYVGDGLPVKCVTWYEAKEYCAKVGKRLPTEAEWEKAARAGTDTSFYWGEEFDPVYASTRTVNAGSKKPNALGLHDMIGNAWEWTADWYDEGYYRKSPGRNPQGPTTGTEKVLRGWSSTGVVASASDRWPAKPEEGSTFAGAYGFRCAK